jgi:hypothetical protein
MAEGVYGCSDFNGNGEECRLIYSLCKAELKIEQIEEQVQAEEDEWAGPGDWCDKDLDAPKTADCHTSHCVQILEYAVT